MSEHEKKRRHDHDHDHHRERPQEANAPGHDGGGEHAHAVSQQQRRLPWKMVKDVRWSEDMLSAVDAEARIIGVSVSGGATHIMIGGGRQDGFHVGMEGYIKAGNGMLADFQIDSNKDHVAYASVEVTPDAIQQGSDLKVVLNPNSPTQSSEPRFELSSRIIGVSVLRGPNPNHESAGACAHGARRPDWPGYIVGKRGKAVHAFSRGKQQKPPENNLGALGKPPN